MIHLNKLDDPPCIWLFFFNEGWLELLTKLLVILKIFFFCKVSYFFNWWIFRHASSWILCVFFYIMVNMRKSEFCRSLLRRSACEKYWELNIKNKSSHYFSSPLLSSPPPLSHTHSHSSLILSSPISLSLTLLSFPSPLVRQWTGTASGSATGSGQELPTLGWSADELDNGSRTKVRGELGWRQWHRPMWICRRQPSLARIQQWGPSVAAARDGGWLTGYGNGWSDDDDDGGRWIRRRRWRRTANTMTMTTPVVAATMMLGFWPAAG